ncbi:potassium transporter 5 [Salvia miltiorrhiza]|uniref:potassium transporter 5 n=1 Tax=Salvia miltiorrhiza TaxID=226208 RepID=UPI0025AD7261|nr:potassium transporter 5 [Salvia miltiorrhiza]
MAEPHHHQTETTATDPAPADANIKERKVSWAKLRRVDSLNMEAGNLSFKPTHHASTQVSWGRTMSLAFQSIGIIYGDIGTSPLYVFDSSFDGEIKHKDDILGVLSLIIYTIILVPMIKYVFIVLWANDNGDGGTFALYSLICRYAKVGLIPNDQPEDRQLSNYRLDTPSNQLRRAQKIKHTLERSMVAKIILFLATILGTAMVIGDGVLTPSISVLSAVEGIKGLGQDAVVYISIAILIILFMVQRFGTDKIGYSFAPAVCTWFMLISGIGLYNLFKHDITVLRAFNPIYIIDYFKRNGKEGWVSLGGVVLCITGTEAMFADLGHFNVPAVQISFSGVVFPSLLAAYIGQAAFLSKFPDHIGHTFYDSVPDPLYWPTFVVAIGAAIIASQAMISGAFAIISQSLSLSCFPRVKVVHTSAKYEGQVYIPEVNYLLMLACVLVTYAFKTTEKIGHAYGIAVVAVMVITTVMVTLIMLMVWKTKIWWILSFFVVFMSVEMLYFSSVLYKFTQGGYLPLALSLVLMTMMGVWHYAQQKRYVFELGNKVSAGYVEELVKSSDVARLPGVGLLYSEMVQGIPPMFPHFISNIPSMHSLVIFVSIKSIPISKVAVEERFLFRQVQPRIFRCVVRYGYKDPIEDSAEFERQLMENLKEFIRHEHFMHQGADADQQAPLIAESGPIFNRKSTSSAVHVEEALHAPPRVSSASIQSFGAGRSANSSDGVRVAAPNGAEEEMRAVDAAMEQGVFYMIGEVEVVAAQESSLMKKFVINYAYSFLRKNFRQGEKMLAIPRNRLLRVGMTYEV